MTHPFDTVLGEAFGFDEADLIANRRLQLSLAQRGRLHQGADAHPDLDVNAYPNLDADAHPNLDANAHPDAHPDAHTNPYATADLYAHAGQFSRN